MNHRTMENTQNLFYERPILNTPYDYPNRHWELVTNDVLDDLKRAKIVFSNYHSFKFRRRVGIVNEDRVAQDGTSENQILISGSRMILIAIIEKF